MENLVTSDWADFLVAPGVAWLSHNPNSNTTKGVVSAGAGFGDAVTFGATQKARQWAGADCDVDYDSGWYGTGEIGGTAATIFVPGEGELRGLAAASRELAIVREVKMSSTVGEDAFLTKAAQQAGRNERVQQEMDSLARQLREGNMNPGLGSKSLPGTDVSYARGRNGARLFFRNVDGGIQIVGKADKGNETAVINRLKDLYGR
jgi:hypothetical protein